MQKNNLIILIIISSFIFLSFEPFTEGNALSMNNPTFPLPKDHPVITHAISYLKNQQQSDGSIGGISISSWVAMAFASVNDTSPSFDHLTDYLLSSIERVNESEKATDWQRHILGLAARNNSRIQQKKPFLTEKLWSFYSNHQFGEENNIYDDCFGVFSLACLKNNTINQTVATKIKQTILEKQEDNGGWNDVDTTALAIMALRIIGITEDSDAIQSAVNFLKDQQEANGGFTSWGAPNTASTAWAISALTTLNTSMNEFIWNVPPPTALDFLLNLQQSDGSFKYTESSHLNPEWMTAYAIIALRGKSFPVTILFSDEKDAGDSSNQNESDDSKEGTKKDEDDKTEQIDSFQNNTNQNQPYFYVHSPRINGIYLNNRFFHLSTKKPVLIGSTTFTIHTNATLDMVVFSINNQVYHIDNSHPYRCTYQADKFVQHLHLYVHGYKMRSNLTEQQIHEWIVQIKQAKQQSKNCYYNSTLLKKLNDFNQWLILEQYTDHQSYWYVNPLKP
jgi:prenyltransferase beta subunit